MSASQDDINAGLQERLKRLRAKLNPAEDKAEADSAFKGHLQAFNSGIANILGAPSDIGTALLNTSMKNGVYGLSLQSQGKEPFQIESPSIGGEKINALGSQLGITKNPKGLTERAARLVGETALPFVSILRGGKVLSETPRAYNAFEEMLISTYRNRYAAAGAESVAIAGAATAGEVASEMYPDSLAAEAIAELSGAIVPGGLASALRFTGSKLPITSVLKETFSKSGSQRRAGARVNEQAADLDTALRNVMSSSELNLDPMTASGDPGVHALFKAALEQDHKLLGRIITKTDEAVDSARSLLLQSGNPQDTLTYLKALRTNAAARAQAAATRLGKDASPVEASRAVRLVIEEALGKAREAEKVVWGKLPTDGKADFGQVASGFEELLRDRALASDPEEIPAFLYSLIGNINKKGEYVPGIVAKNPTFKEMKALKTRLGNEIATEMAKDVSNQNKVRILGDVQENIFESLKDLSPEYANAVAYSRGLNESFTQGRIGKLLGHRRGGGKRVSPDGTLEFLFSGNKRDVRDGLQQLAQTSPESIAHVKGGVKSMFVAQATTDGGIVNSANAQKFLRNNKHILDELPDVRADIEKAIDTQVVVDTFAGRNIDSALSTFQKEKSATALYLNQSPEKAMEGLLSARTDAGQGALMKELVDITNQDPSGKATKGLRTSFAQQLIRRAEGQNIDTLSGKKMLKDLEEWGPAAAQLYKGDPAQLTRTKKIANELRLIEARNSARASKGGLISDTPNKIISLVTGTFAARAGAKAGAGSSGASLRTASIFTKEWNNIMGRLTNDGAEQILLKATEDPKVLAALLQPVTQKNMEKSARIFSSFLSGQALTLPGRASEQQKPDRSTQSLEDKLKILREQSSLGALNQPQAPSEASSPQPAPTPSPKPKVRAGGTVPPPRTTAERGRGLFGPFDDVFGVQ